MKSYTDIEQSKKLAEFLPLESADMTLPFRHPKNDEYIPGYVVSRDYVEVYNEMMKLPLMEKEDVCKLIQPTWSLAALLGVLPEINGIPITLEKLKAEDDYEGYYYHIEYKDKILIPYMDNPVDACYELILKLHELNLL